MKPYDEFRERWMKLAIVAIAAVLTVGACGADDSANSKPAGEYATGELPTSDTVQRESDLQIASQEDERNQEERESQE